MPRPTITAAGLAAVAAGCGGEPPRGFDAPDANARVDAIVAESAAEAPAYPRLIEQLGSDDPLARLVAIEALERRTGRTFDYRPHDEEPARRAAVERWIAWYRAGATEP
jgi:hypothetical protein